MKKLNLGIDIDGTVTEPYYWLQRANQFFHTRVKPKEVTEYEIDKILGISREEYDKFYRQWGETLHKEAKVRTGVAHILGAMSQQHELHFITAREDKMQRVSEDWLKANNIPADTLTLLGHSNKVNEAKKRGCGIFIEDCYENAIILADGGIDVLLIDCSYNQGALPKNVQRVKNWYEIRQIIDFGSKYSGQIQCAVPQPA